MIEPIDRERARIEKLLRYIHRLKRELRKAGVPIPDEERVAPQGA